jgi:hypothetical protein
MKLCDIPWKSHDAMCRAIPGVEEGVVNLAWCGHVLSGGPYNESSTAIWQRVESGSYYFFHHGKWYPQTTTAGHDALTAQCLLHAYFEGTFLSNLGGNDASR